MSDTNYNNDSDYSKPYHWLLKPWHITYGGMEYYEYASYVIAHAAAIQPKNILDIGCGDGRITDMTANATGARTLGIDISQKAINFAKQYAKSAKFECVSIEDLAKKQAGKYDLITLIEVIEHLSVEEADKWFGLFKILLSEDGRLLITVPTVNYPMLHPGHVRHFNRLLLVNLCISHNYCIEKIEWLYDMKGCWVHSTGYICRQLLRMVDNKYLNIKFITAFLSDYHSKKYSKSVEADAGRLLAVVRKA